MNEREYIKLRKQIQDDFHKKISALDTVWGISNACPVPVISEETNKRQPKGVAASHVMKAVASFGLSPFTTKEIDDKIQEHGYTANRTTISHKLKALVKGGSLRVVSEGKGKKATVFAQAASDNETQDPAADSEKEEKVNLLKNYLIHCKVDVEEFKEFILTTYGVTKLAELNNESLDILISQYSEIASAQ